MHTQLDHSYLQHWGLANSPFRMQADPARAYPSSSIGEAIARVEYLVGERRRLAVLVGEQGVGKSLALAVAARELRRRGADVALVDAAGITTRELLWQTAVQLGAGPMESDETQKLWRRIADHLAENRWQGRASILLLDDCAALGPDQQSHLLRLARLESQTDARWTLLLAMEQGQLGRLCPQLLELIDMKIELERWEADDSEGYVQHALLAAGRLAPVFTDGGLAALHELAEGSPRHVARLADFALLAGAGAGAEQIDGALVQAAFDEIAWRPEGPDV
ncbi:hypothetical protein Pla175_00210 [Pirellulimonas nuda]|uniref:AAA+ ATPase domain-containing protein n=1 Tax=Pirellulimonas nuda TaxID=2528009 RepID=A0A518D5C3_9BACT|nr:AAA family ATPase [Pirellulimonas nuda]QDU86671.1 hypothetical protein Pla175_00210 [Pirellulimonas nuda]